MRRLWQALRVLFSYCDLCDKFLVVAGTLCATAAGIGYLAFDYLMWATIGTALGNTKSSIAHTLVEMGYFLVAIAIALLFFSTLSEWLLRIAASRRCDRMKRLFVESLLARDVAWFEKEPESVHESFLFLQDSIPLIEAGIGNGYKQFVFSVSICVGGFIGSFVVSTQLSLVLLGTMPLIVAGMAAVSRFTVLAADLDAKAFSSAARAAMGALRGIKTVATFQQESRELSKFENLLLKSKNVVARTAFFQGIGLMAAQGIAVIDMGIGLYFMASVTQDGTARPVIDGSTLVWVLTTMIYGGLSLGYSTEGLTAMATAVESIARMTKELNPALTRKKLEKKTLDFPINSGQKFSIVAPRNYDISPIAIQAVSSVPGVVGFVGNEPGIVNGTVKENLLLGWPEEKSLPTDNEILTVLSQVGLGRFLDCLPNQFDALIKRGEYPPMTPAQERQLSLARALLRKPDLLVLDRVSEGLVTEDERVIDVAVRSTVKRLKDDPSVTVIAIPNGYRDIDIYDKIIVLNIEGQFVECGSHTTLLEAPSYTSLLRQNDPDLLGSPQNVLEDRIPPILPHVSDELTANVARPSIRTETAIVNRPLRLVQTPNSVSWKRILGLSKEYWGFVFPLAVVGSCLVGAVPPVVFFVLSQLTEAFDTAPVFDNSKRFMLLLFFLGALMALASFVKEVAYGRIREGTVRRVRLQSMNHILNQPVDIYEAGNTPESVMSSLWRRCYSTGVIAAVVINSTAECVSWFFIAVVISFIASWRVAAMSVGSMLALLIGYCVFYKYLPEQSSETSCVLIADTLSSIRTVKLNKAEQDIVNLFIEALAFESKNQKINSVILSLFSALPFSVCPLLTSFGFWYAGIIFETTEGLTLPQIVQTTYGVGDAGELAMFVISWLPDFLRFEKDAVKVFDLLDNDFSFDKGETVFESEVESISFHRVSFAYSYSLCNQVLFQLSFEFQRHQIIGLVGPFRSGKTSVLNLIQRLYDPQYGKILINDTNIREFTVDSYRRVQAVVPQQPVLLEGTFKHNVLYGLSACEKETSILEHLTKSCILDFVKNWDAVVRPAELSPSQAQRISIARALARNPELLLLDEPFALLHSDEGLAARIRTNIEKSRKGRITIISTTYCECVKNADRIFVVDDGTLVQSGTFETLMADENGIFVKMGLT